MRLADWEDTVRLARQARLLGFIAHRLLERVDLWEAVPKQVRGHLQSAIHYSAHRVQAVQMELAELEQALPPGMQVALLKGAAYLAQSMSFARGRVPNDVDLLVRRSVLETAESALLAAGWKSEVSDAYDQRYYREWSHELPPMRFPGHALEVDLHHTIAPITGRARADDDLLFANPLPLAHSRYFVLAPQDQIIHAAIHLFQDSDLGGRLRDLVDIDGLIRHHLADEAGWPVLRDRAERHGACPALWYALHYCRSWLGTPVPGSFRLKAPPAWARAAMDWVFPRCCPARIPDRPPGVAERLAGSLGRIRYHYLRMPPALLARHLCHKVWLTVRPRPAARTDTMG